MREKSGRMGHVSNKLKALLLALAAVFAVSAISASSANAADGTLKMTFDEGKIAVLPELLGPIDANPPAESPVTVQGALAEDGAFSATQSGFNFPTQRIELPADEPLIASILGPHVDIILGATGPFTGNFDRATGAFTSSIPLALTLQFDPPEADLACRLPFNLAVNTTDTLTFPGAGEGGGDLSFPAAAFASPSRDGAIYGSWPAVPFSSIENAPPMAEGTECAELLALLPAFIEDWPEGLDGLQGEIWLGGKAEVVDPPAECPPGKVGTPPNCTDPVCPAPKVGTPPNCTDPLVVNISKVAVTPAKGSIKKGKKATLTIKVTNSGTKSGTVTVKVTSSNKQVKAPKTVKVTVGAKKTVSKKITVSATKKAKGKATITAKVGSKSGKSTLTVKK